MRLHNAQLAYLLIGRDPDGHIGPVVYNGGLLLAKGFEGARHMDLAP